MKITRALISVSDKTGLDVLARGLHDLGVELLSTGGSAQFLRDLGIPVTEVTEYTGYPECFGGRVKTLHPRIHGGLLFRRDDSEHARQAEENDVPPIDLLVVNLYPFEQTVAREGVTRAEAIENIDIGGPALLRGACKNFESVTVLSNPADYDAVLEELRSEDGETSLRTRERLAIQAFQLTSRYDAAIANYLSTSCSSSGAGSFGITLPLETCLRHGENPHQEARLYGNFSDYFEKLQGKELSYTNVLDIEAAAELVLEFKRPTVAILKHTNPCGVGCDDDDLRGAWEKAFQTDRQAPFGGVIVTNRPLPERLARVISEIFTDVIIAPEFEAEARAILQKKKNLRLIEMNAEKVARWMESAPVVRSTPGGLIVMDRDGSARGLQDIDEKAVTKRQPSKDEIEAMRFAWRVVKHVKSNAIVFAGDDRTLGIGAGQMSRVDSCRIAVWKAQEAGLPLDGSVVASDALFPFADGLIAAAEAGATAAIQPGGSIRDAEVIAAADERNMTMVFTGIRHFLH